MMYEVTITTPKQGQLTNSKRLPRIIYTDFCNPYRIVFQQFGQHYYYCYFLLPYHAPEIQNSFRTGTYKRNKTINQSQDYLVNTLINLERMFGEKAAIVIRKNNRKWKKSQKNFFMINPPTFSFQRCI